MKRASTYAVLAGLILSTFISAASAAMAPHNYSSKMVYQKPGSIMLHHLQR